MSVKILILLKFSKNHKKESHHEITRSGFASKTNLFD